MRSSFGEGFTYRGWIMAKGIVSSNQIYSVALANISGGC